MATFASDVFTGADGDPVAAQAMVAGGPWVEHGSYTPNVLYANNMAAGPGTSQVGMVYATTGAPSANYTVQGLVTTTTAGSSGAAGVAGRVATGANTMYVADYYDDATAGSRAFRLYGLSAGALIGGALLGSYTQNLGSSGSATIKLEMIGSALKVYVDGVERISASEGTITAAGYAGIRIGNQTGAYSTGVRLDDFTADTIPTGLVPVRRSFSAFRGVYTR